MEKDPEQRDPEAENRDQTDEPDSGETTQPVDGPGDDEDDKGATSQGQPG